MRGLAALTTVVAAIAVLAPAASSAVPVRFERLEGFDARETPARYARVGVLEVGPRRAPNVLILNPGTSASAAYFAPLARTVVRRARGWQVWAVERRENLLEDHSVLNRAKRGRASGQELFDYYLGFLADSSISPHFEFVPDDDARGSAAASTARRSGAG